MLLNYPKPPFNRRLKLNYKMIGAYLNEGLFNDCIQDLNKDKRGKLQIIDISRPERPVLSDGKKSAPFFLEYRCRKNFREFFKINDIIVTRIYAISETEFVLNDVRLIARGEFIIGTPIAFNGVCLPPRDLNLENGFQERENGVNINLGRREVLHREVEEVNQRNNGITGMARRREQIDREAGEEKEEGINQISNGVTGVLITKGEQKKHKNGTESFFTIEIDCGNKNYTVVFWNQANAEKYNTLKVGFEYNFINLLPSNEQKDAQYYKENKLHFNWFSNFKQTKKTQIQIRQNRLQMSDEELNAELPTEFIINKVEDIQRQELNAQVSVAVIVIANPPVKEIENAKGRFRLRTLSLRDKTGIVALTVWEDSCDAFEYKVNQVLALINFTVREFKGIKELAVGRKSRVMDDLTSHRIYNDLINLQGTAVTPVGLRSNSQNKSMSATAKIITSSGLLKEYTEFLTNSAEKYKRVVFEAQIGVNGRSFYYPACLSEGCKRKVVRMQSGKYFCQSCAKEFERIKPACLMKIKIKDSRLPFATSFMEEHFAEMFDMDFVDYFDNYDQNFTIDSAEILQILIEKMEGCVFEVELNFKKCVTKFNDGCNIIVERLKKLETRPVNNRPNNLMNLGETENDYFS